MTILLRHKKIWSIEAALEMFIRFRKEWFKRKEKEENGGGMISECKAELLLITDRTF